MIQPNSIFSQIDPLAKRRHALAKVYSLLIRVAEKAENHTPPADSVGEETKSTELASVQAVQLNKEVSVCLDPEFLNSDVQQTNNSVPLQNNIPS